MKTKTNHFSVVLLTLLMVSQSFASGWNNYSNITLTTDVLAKNNTLWITAKGGIIKVDQTTGLKTFIHKGEAGLVSASVEKIITNALTGDTWIGTYDNGLARWNGTSFVSYPFPQNMFLKNMRFDQFGKIWMESDMGLYRFDPATGIYTKINDAPSNAWTYNAWGYDFLTKNKAAVFNGTTSLIIDVVSGAVLDSFQTPIDTSVHIPGDLGLNALFLGCSPISVSNFGIDSESCLLQISNAVVIHEKNGVLRRGDAGMQIDEMVVNIIRNESGELILFSDQRNLYKWNAQSWSFIANVPVQSQASKLLSIYNGTYYFNTSDDVIVYSFTGSTNTTYDARQYPFASNHIRAIVEKPSGEVIIASGNKLLSYDALTNNWKPFLTVPSKYDMVGKIKFLNGYMYYADYGNMMYRYDGVAFDSVPKLTNGMSNDVYDYDVEPDGTVWFVNGDGLLKYNGVNTVKMMGNIPNRYFTSVKFDDARRTLWIGSSKGIIKYDLDFGTSLVIDHNIVSQMIGGEAIQTIEADKNNAIWFGANNSRAITFDGTQYTVLGLPNAQTNDFVVDIAFDADTVYFNMSSGNGGVYKYFNGNFQFLHPSTVPQLVSAINDDILVDRSGSLWIAHDDAGVSAHRTGTATKIETVKAEQIGLYPNPTNAMVNLVGRFGAEAIYSVVNVEGQIVASGKYLNNGINLSALNAGLYNVVVIDANGRFTGRVLKQ